MKKIYILYFIVLVLFSSGCSNNSNSTQNIGGVDLYDVSFLPGELISDETTKLTCTVQNNGDYDADVNLYLQTLDENKWDVDKSPETIINLAKKDQDFPGGKKTDFFKLTAPEIEDKNTRQIYNAEIKMCYLYTTQTVFKYDIIDSFEKQKEIEQGKYKKTYPFFKNSASPISVSPLTKQPLFTTEDNDITLAFEVKNNKNGLIANSNKCRSDPYATDINEFEFEITLDDVEILCDEEEVRLIDGKMTFYCTLESEEIKDKNSITLNLISNYAYYETKSAKVSVDGLDN